MEGIWKVSFALSRAVRRVGGSIELPVAVKAVPKRLRFIDPEAAGVMGRLEVPMSEEAHGSWTLTEGPPDASGAQSARFVVEGTGAVLLFNGLYDGERIAGTVHELPSPAEGGGLVTQAVLLEGVSDCADNEQLGEFLCTRLFSFWGTPKPKAGQPPPGG